MDIILHWIEHEHLAPLGATVSRDGGARMGTLSLRLSTLVVALVVPLGMLLAASSRAAGPVVGWGDNSSGQTTVPAAVNGTAGTATAIAAGWSYSCAIQAGSNAVVCWGSNDYGQATPPPSVNGTDGTATAIAAGIWHSCAIQAGSNAVVCWGRNDYGQLTPPPSVNGTDGTATAIALGGTQTSAIQAGTGKVVCWDMFRTGETATPDSVNGTAGTATAIAASLDFWQARSCAIQAITGKVVCWQNQYGQAFETAVPAAVNGADGAATAIAMGWTESCAIQAGTGKVVCWRGPGPASTFGTATAIAVGGIDNPFGGSTLTTCVIRAGTGNVVCWDWNNYDQTTPPSVNGTAGTATAISAGSDHILAIAGPARAACQNGVDDDGDGKIDFPADADCASPLDASEGTDSDGDGVPDGLDNCPYEPNAAQADIGGLGTAPPDGIGDACQGGDTNNDGRVTATDSTVLKRALLGLSPYFEVAALPGLSKCNVGATVVPGIVGCTTSDASVIARALLGLTPGIAQHCDAASP